MAFFECEFPRDIAYSARGGPSFFTTINKGFSGHEQRNRNWALALAKWKIALDHKPIAYFQEVYDFWLNVGGQADSFRFYDHKDFQAVNQVCAQIQDSPFTGRLYQLQMTYTVGNRSYTKPIYKPITSAVQKFNGSYCTETVVIKVGGNIVSNWTLDPTTGILTFSTAPSGTVTWSGSFHWPARFNIDDCQAVLEESDILDGQGLITWPDVELIEVRTF